MVFSGKVSLQTKGNNHVIDITSRVADEVARSKVTDGSVTLFVIGSTAGITTVENEPGLVKDFQDAWERLVPENISYRHDAAWGESNGHSHVRASILGPSLTIPIVDKAMTLGTWQQIVFVDFDIRPRSREVVVQVVGE